MTALLFFSARSTVSNVIQLIAGCLLAIIIYKIFKKWPFVISKSSRYGIITIFLFSIFGTILPFGIYGVIPLTAAILAVGFDDYTICSLFISNVMFNMTVPFNDPGFVWRTGYRQVVLAIAAGLLAGMVLYVGKRSINGILRKNNIPEVREFPSGFRMFVMLIDDNIKKLCLFLIAGSIADTIFQRCLLGNIVNAFYSNTITAAIPAFFGGHDVSNPFFLLTFAIIYMLMNMVNFSALLAVFKIRGLFYYFGYFLLWAILLAIPAFI